MSTDLTTVRDHPAAILDGYAERLSPEALPKTPDETQPAFAMRLVQASHYAASASVLRRYEAEHGVTFAALDNDTLERIRQAEDIWSEGDERAGDALLEIGQAVRDLLGLGQ